MDRSRVAEFVLSCVLPAERAAAVTGDFLEEAGERGGFWFWSSVFRTVASGVWSDIREAPGELIWLGVRGFFENLVGIAWYGACLGLLLSLAFLLAGWMMHAKLPVQGDSLVLLIAIWVATRGTGQSLGRRVPDRKLAACVSFFVVSQVIQIAIGLVIGWYLKVGMPSFSWRDLVFLVALFYGALKSGGRKPAAQGGSPALLLFG